MFITNSRSFISVSTEIKPLLKELKSGASQVTKWGTPVEKWKHNQTPNTTHSLKVGRLFNINEYSSLVPVKVNTDSTSPDCILLPCFKSTKPGSPVKAFLFAPLSGALGTSWESSCESDLISRHQRPASLMLLLLNGSKSLLPGSKIQWNAWKNRKLETSDFSRRCSIITSRCCVQVWNQRSDTWWFICILLYF